MEPVELLKTINLGMHNVGKLYEEKTYFCRSDYGRYYFKVF